MQFRRLHPWDVPLQEAAAIQKRLASMVSCANVIPDQSTLVAGADLSPPDAEGLVWAGVVVLRLPELQVVEVRRAGARPPFPYVPGFLSFRESPVLVRAFERLTLSPDFILVDGQGIAHPRRLGIASHLGVLADVPTIGCAKSILVGTHGPLGEEKGAWVPLLHRGETVGAVLRTREGTTPIYVSIGHKVDLEAAIRWVLACCTRYRLPEPTRLAHQAAAGRIPERAPGQPGQGSQGALPLA